MKTGEILRKIRKKGKKKNVEGMKRFGIRPKTKLLGVSMPDLRIMAKKIGTDHFLAQKLWKTKVHEARLVAAIIADPEKITEREAESWAKDFDSWSMVDNTTNELLRHTDFAWKKVREWSRRKEEFVKRAGFALLANLAVHSKKASDEEFIKFLGVIKREAKDDRNFVKKAVNWALREIGKRNKRLNKKAIKTAREIKKINSKPARWIAGDAIRELTCEKIQERFKK